MRHMLLPVSLLAAFLGLAFAASPAQAQATRTWISGVGDDANPCSRTAPCKTFAGAISKTAVNGEINCLDPGGFGAVTITKSITLDCHEVYGSILVAGTNGIVINFDAFAGTDTRKTARIRNLNFNGANSGLNGIRVVGAAASAGSAVFIEDCMIDGFFGSPGRGISDERTGGGELYVTNTTVRNNGATGIVINPAAGASAGAKIAAILDNVRVHNSNFGVSVGSAANVMISRSVFVGNTQAGVEAEGPFSPALVNINNSTISSNGTGITAAGGSTIVISNNNIAFNTTAISGTTSSFGNNRITGTVGVAPTFIGSPTSSHGEQ